jgi:hypothetical protein
MGPKRARPVRRTAGLVRPQLAVATGFVMGQTIVQTVRRTAGLVRPHLAAVTGSVMGQTIVQTVLAIVRAQLDRALAGCVSVSAMAGFPIASADAEACGSSADPPPTVQAQVTTPTAAAAAILDRFAIIPARVVCVIRPAGVLPRTAVVMVVLLPGVVVRAPLQLCAFLGCARVIAALRCAALTAAEGVAGPAGVAHTVMHRERAIRIPAAPPGILRVAARFAGGGRCGNVQLRLSSIVQHARARRQHLAIRNMTAPGIPGACA